MATKKTSAKTVQRPLGRREKTDASHAWLERTNPLARLSIRNAQSIWDAARGGDTQRLHWLFQEIEAANPVLLTCVERRNAALAGFSPIVTVRPDADGALGDEQKDAVERFLAGIENLPETIEHLALAWFRGFAFAQPIWLDDGSVREVALPNSWEFLTHDGELYHNPYCDGWQPDHCTSCADARLVDIRRVRAIDYPALAIHIRHAVSERDWGRFLERYALPKPAVVMAPNATEDQKADYLAAAACVENGQVSVWPNGVQIADFAGGSRGTDPFNSFIEHQERTVVLLATGGTLTSLAQADTGSLAGGAQMEVWREIVARDAVYIARALYRDLVKPYILANFPSVAVDFALEQSSRRTPKEAADLAVALKSAGWLVDKGELEKATGFTLTPAPEPAAPAFGLARARKGEDDKPDPDDLEKAIADALTASLAAELAQTPLQNAEEPLQNARSEKDRQGDPQANPPLKTQKNGLLSD